MHSLEQSFPHAENNVSASKPRFYKPNRVYSASILNKHGNSSSNFSFVKPNSSVSNPDSCPLCKESHVLYICPRFKDMNAFERRNTVNRLRLCFICLRGQHLAQNCPSKIGCKVCQTRHHTMWHIRQPVQIRNMNLRTSRAQAEQFDDEVSSESGSSEHEKVVEADPTVQVNSVFQTIT